MTILEWLRDFLVGDMRRVDRLSIAALSVLLCQLGIGSFAILFAQRSDEAKRRNAVDTALDLEREHGAVDRLGDRVKDLRDRVDSIDAMKLDKRVALLEDSGQRIERLLIGLVVTTSGTVGVGVLQIRGRRRLRVPADVERLFDEDQE